MSTTIDTRTDKQKEIDLRYKRRVLAGIAFLEEKYGKNWADLGQEQWAELFDIRSATECVLGGIGRGLGEGDYGDLADKLGIGRGDQYGFSVSTKEDDPEVHEEDVWDSLQRLWVDELRARGVSVQE